MNVTINNFRGLASASLDLSKICLLAGPNEAGKTSTVQALAAALTGDPVPIAGVKKTQAGMLVRSGTANGSVKLVGTTGTTEIQWPAAKVKTEGQAPFASHFAAGLQSIVNMDDKERVKILTEYLKAVPTRADLDSQLASMNLPAAVLDQLWQLIETQGWDNAYAQIKEKGARLKGQWENITGDRYGSKKADSWIPEGYDNELMGKSETTLQAIVTDARDALEAAIAAEAVDDSKRAELEALAAKLTEREEAAAKAKAAADQVDNIKLKDLESQVASGREMVRGAKQHLDEQKAKANPKPESMPHERMFCPCCKAMLFESAGVLKEVKDNPESIEDQKAAIKVAEKAVIEATANLEEYTNILADLEQQLADEKKSFDAIRAEQIGAQSEAERLVKESQKAAKELGTPVAPASELSVEDCRTTLARAEVRAKAFTQKYEADRLHTSIGQNAELMVKIAPEGIRGDVLTRALKGFNDSMARFSAAAGWRTVTLESDFMPTYGGTIYLLLSESAKFRVRVLLQIGMALMDKSQALIIDAADILDKGGRNGLFKAVHASGLPSLVAMTMDTKELVPNLGKIGCSYWLNSDATAEAV